MSNKRFFTVNFLIRSDSNLKKAISSVIGNGKFFTEHIQLILIDSVGSELSTEICTSYSNTYPENIYFIDAVGETAPEGYNNTAAISAGRYVVFTDNYGVYSEGAFESTYNMIKSGRVPVFCIKPMCDTTEEKNVPYVPDLNSGTIRLHDTPDKFILMLCCYFFRRDVVRRISFDKSLRFDYDSKYIVEVLSKTHSYFYTEGCSVRQLRPTERDIIRYEPQYSSMFYSRSIQDFMIPMLKAYVGSPFVMSAMMYLLEVKFALNGDDTYKKVLVGSKVKEFFEVCSKALGLIDDTVIINKRLCRLSGLDEEMTMPLLRMKYKDSSLAASVDLVPPRETVEYKYRVAENRIVSLPLSGEFAAHLDGVLISRSRDIYAGIRTINFDSDGIYIDARLVGCSLLNEKDYSVYAVINGIKNQVVRSRVYALRKYFGETFVKRYCFRLFVPVEGGKKIETMSLYLRYKKLAFRLKLSFETLYAKLSDDMKNSYALFGDRILTYDKKNKLLVTRRATDSLAAISESRFMGETASAEGLVKQFYYRRIRRNARALMREKGNKKIIVFYEDKGINYNGNLLFRYFFKNKRDSFEPYICVRRESPEQTFLLDTGYDNVLETGSQKAKAMVLAADLLFASDCDPYDSLGFTASDKLYLRDMMKAATVSVKNYFMTYESAQYNNRLRDNTQAVFCSSQREKENLLDPIYDYDESMIKVTGSAILDAVSNKKERLILISPGKRRLFGIYENSAYYKFTESTFFKEYNYILTNPGLLDECRVRGWKIAVMLPPSVEKYLKLFSASDVVTLCPYNEQNETSLISRGAVLVTDYSDLQFRFAYMGKNVVYFFPTGMPVGSEHKGENLSANGFGEILFNKEELCEYLIRGMEDSFRRTEKYKLRRNSFFGKQDKSNCRRIFEAAMRLISELY